MISQNIFNIRTVHTNSIIIIKIIIMTTMIWKYKVELQCKLIKINFYLKSVCTLSQGLISNDILFSVLLTLFFFDILSFSETVRLLRLTSPFSARKLPRLISAASTMRMFTLYSWQWLSCPAVRYVRFWMLLTEHVITTLGPVSWRITSSATNLFPLCDSSNISYKMSSLG